MKKLQRTPVTSARLRRSSSAWDREQQRLHQMNVAAVFGGEAAEDDDDDEEAADESDDRLVTCVAEHSDQPRPLRPRARWKKKRSKRKKPTWPTTSRTSKKMLPSRNSKRRPTPPGEHEHEPAQEIAASAETCIGGCRAVFRGPDFFGRSRRSGGGRSRRRSGRRSRTR